MKNNIAGSEDGGCKSRGNLWTENWESDSRAGIRKRWQVQPRRGYLEKEHSRQKEEQVQRPCCGSVPGALSYNKVASVAGEMSSER